MRFISHRGNLYGKVNDKENNPSYIFEALNLGYEVEIDVWFTNKNVYLGHDKPEHQVNLDFLQNNKLWCHAKNYEAFELMLDNKNIHCFWHQNDDYTLTSKGIIWAYPGNGNFKNAIDVMPEMHIDNLKFYRPSCLGVCSDYIANIRKEFNA